MFRRIFLFTVILAVAVMSVCFSACGRATEDAAAARTGQPPSPPAAEETLLPDSAAPPAVMEGAALPAVRQSDEPDPASSVELQERIDGVPAGPALAEREMVDDGFFADAAFFGNSLVEGLGGFGGLQNGDFYAHASAALYNLDTEVSAVLDGGDAGTLYEAMTQRQYQKIYILFGINEIAWEPAYFGERYEALLDRLRRDEPGAEIYIMSLTPVTREISEYHEYFNLDRVRAYNEVLLALAEKTGCWYVDLCQALAGEDGYLPQELSSFDGIHFTKDAYLIWADFLRTHYAV